MDRLQAAFAGRMSAVLVEPMITGGVETIVGVVQEPVFGPVVVFGVGGVATDVLGDHAARLAPLTDADADDLIHHPRRAGAARPWPGRRRGAVRDTLLRVSQLADDLPQVVELDLNPVIARPDGVVAVDARIRVTSHHLADPFRASFPLDHPRRAEARAGEAALNVASIRSMASSVMPSRRSCATRASRFGEATGPKQP